MSDEIDFIKTCASHCTDKTSILDIGANEGGYTYTFQSFPHKEIHAFEPCPALAQKTKERFKDNPAIKVFQCGVSDKEFSDSGYSVFEAWTIDKPDTAKRSLSQGALDIVGKELFDINFITIDDHVKRENLDNIDLIKLDVDGYELRALKGAKETIQKHRPLILIEISYMVDDIGDSVPEFLDLIYDELNYTLYDQWAVNKNKQDMTNEYPWNTSYDMAMIPSEVSFNDIKKKIKP